MVITSYPLSISPQETSLRPENYRGLGHAVGRFVCGIESRFTRVSCSVTTVGLSARFGAIVRRSHQQRIRLQALRTQSARKLARRAYPDDERGHTERRASWRDDLAWVGMLTV